VAEYNIWVDPEAAKIVFESGLPIEMVGWDISVESAVFDPQETARLRDIGTPLAKFCVDIQKSLTQFALKRTKLAGFDLPDPIAMAVAIDPSIATKTERRYVQIDTQSDLTLGQTVVDQLGVTGKPPNATVVKEASRERFIQLLHDSVRA
jgi:purine nucleosidase